MRYGFVGYIAVAAIFAMTEGPTLAQTTATASKAAPSTKAWTQPKTPWGDPDLQGTWTSDDCIGAPMNRAANFGDRLYYTEQEIA